MPDTERYAPAERLHTLRNLLASRACTIPEIASELRASESTVRRLLRALERAGEPLTEETRDDRRKAFRVASSAAKTVSVRLTAGQLATLVLARKAVSFLEGTGFDVDLDDVVAQLSVTLRETDAELAKNLETKIFDVNEHPHDYEGREDDVDEIITALMREERLHVRHGSVRRGEERFAFEPYSLLLYKKGLYFAGHSGWHGRVVTFALDGFRSVERARGERFAYPKGWDPRSVVGNAFGLIGGPTTRVRIWFAKEVARHVRRRRWHATRSYEKVDDGVVLTMEVGGTKELTSWVLGWGSQAKVLEPSSLQAEVAAEIAKMGARYAP